MLNDWSVLSDAVYVSKNEEEFYVKKQKSIVALCLAVFMLVGLLAGCSGGAPPASSAAPAAPAAPTAPGTPAAPAAPAAVKYAEELIVSAAAAPTAMDPNASAANAMRRFTGHIYESLLKLDPATKVPSALLAEKWEQPSPTEYVFHLRKGVKFHNGETLTAADVKRSEERRVGKEC